MAEQRKNNHDDSWFPWALIIFLFVIKVWPIALIMLFIKLFGEDERKERTAPPPLRKPVQTQRGQPMVKQAVREGAAWRGDPVSNRAAPMSKRTAPAGKARTAMKKAAKSPGMKKSNAWLLKIAGAALALFGVMVTGTLRE